MSEEEIQLSEMHRLFVAAVIKHNFNAVRAYMEVYPNSNYKSAQPYASRLLARDDIKSAVRKELNDILAAEKQEIERLLYQSIQESLSASLTDYLDDEGNVDINAVREINPKAIESLDREINQTDSGTRIKTRIRLADRAKAREHAARLLGLMDDKSGNIIIINPPQGLDEL